ncbi:hypothetical protein QE152_g29796 [Popillia japonica]|uniref:Uncharacterized protein n=1 Tax=Popillia japonica TaxID=7064 RepID=A0AAW1JG84_POPJA
MVTDSGGCLLSSIIIFHYQDAYNLAVTQGRQGPATIPWQTPTPQSSRDGSQSSLTPKKVNISNSSLIARKYLGHSNTSTPCPTPPPPPIPPRKFWKKNTKSSSASSDLTVITSRRSSENYLREQYSPTYQKKTFWKKSESLDIVQEEFSDSLQQKVLTRDTHSYLVNKLSNLRNLNPIKSKLVDIPEIRIEPPKRVQFSEGHSSNIQELKRSSSPKDRVSQFFRKANQNQTVRASSADRGESLAAIEQRRKSSVYSTKPAHLINSPYVRSQVNKIAGQRRDSNVDKNQENETKLVTRSITDYFRDKAKEKFSPPPPDLITGGKRTLQASNSPRSSSTRSSDNMSVGRNPVVRVLSTLCGGGLKIKERMIVGFCVAVVLFTMLLVLLVIDLQMDLGMSGQKYVPSHGKVKFGRDEDGPGSAYNSFRKRFLQKTHRMEDD